MIVLSSSSSPGCICCALPLSLTERPLALHAASVFKVTPLLSAIKNLNGHQLSPLEDHINDIDFFPFSSFLLSLFPHFPLGDSLQHGGGESWGWGGAITVVRRFATQTEWGNLDEEGVFHTGVFQDLD